MSSETPEPKKCPECRGTGLNDADYMAMADCPVCNGTGLAPEPELNVEAELGSTPPQDDVERLRKKLLDIGHKYEDKEFMAIHGHCSLDLAAIRCAKRVRELEALIQQVSDQRVREFSEDLKRPIQTDIVELEYENETLYSGGDDDWEDRARAIIGQKLSVLRQHQSRIDQTLSTYLSHKEQSDEQL